MKILKKLLAGIISVGIIASMTGFTVAAGLFDDDDDTSTSDSVLEATTIKATVKRVSAVALIVTPDASAGLGDSLGVSWKDSNSFSEGDTVEIVYSSAVSEKDGVKYVTADSVKKTSSGSSSSGGNILDDDKPAVTTPATTTPSTTTPSADTSAKPTSTTPSTGDKGVAGLVCVAVLCGTADVIYELKKGKKDEEVYGHDKK